VNKVSSESGTKKAIIDCPSGRPQSSGAPDSIIDFVNIDYRGLARLYACCIESGHTRKREVMPPCHLWPCSNQVRLYPMHLLSTPYSHLINLPTFSSHEGRQCNQIGYDTEITSEPPRSTRPRLTVSRGRRSSSSVTIIFKRTWMNTRTCRRTWPDCSKRCHTPGATPSGYSMARTGISCKGTPPK